MLMIDVVREGFDDVRTTAGKAAERLGPVIVEAAELIISTLCQGGCVYVFGNGGSAADAQHFSCELVGRFLKDRRPLRAEALSTDTSVLTAIGNDFGFSEVFARQLEGKGKRGDTAIGFSSSGASANVVKGLDCARRLGLRTIAVTGQDGGDCSELADVLLNVPSRSTPRIQEVTTVLCHILCELVDNALTEPTSDEGRVS